MEKSLLVEAQAASNLDTIFKHHLAKKTDRQPKFHAQTPHQFTLLFPPEGQTVTGIAGEFEAQLLDRSIPALLFIFHFNLEPRLRGTAALKVARRTSMFPLATRRAVIRDYRS